MVRDAELHADEDRKLREMVELRNQAENLIHGTEKSLETLGEQASDAEKADVKSKIDALRGTLDGDDKEAVTAAMEALSASASELAQRAYAASAGGAEGAEGVDANASADAADDAVDAEFEEVKDDDNKPA